MKENKKLKSDPTRQKAQHREIGLLQTFSKYKHRFSVVIIVVAVIGYWIHTGTWAHTINAFLGPYPSPVFAVNMLVTYLAILLCYVLWEGYGRAAIVNALLNFGAVAIILLLVELPAVLGWVDYRVLLVPKMIGGAGPHNRQLEPTSYFHRPAYDQFVNALPGDAAVVLGLNGHGRYAAEHRYDHNGFRNDRDLEHASVVLIGDSFVEGYKVTQEKIISAHLEQFLDIDVSNLGQGDFGPETELVVLRILGTALRPSVVVWFFFEGNDLYDYQRVQKNWKGYVREYYSYKNRSFLRNIVTAAALQTNRVLHRWQDNPLRRSALLMSQIPNQDPKMYFEFTPDPVTDQFLAYFEKFQGIIREAKSICDQNRIHFLLVYVPLKFRVYRDLLVFPKESSAGRWSLNDFPERFAQWSEAFGVPHLDLTPALKRAANSGIPVYYTDDAHWTAEGHELVAQEIANLIRDRGWLDMASPESN